MSATYQPQELTELHELFAECSERVARALHVEPHLGDPLGGMYAIGDALRELTAGLREWHADCARPDQRRVTPQAATELEQLVHGGSAR